jgi:Xaa-Pro aminopeptidase
MIHRRDVLTGGGAALLTAAALETNAVRAQTSATREVTGNESAKLFLKADDLQPATVDRLPLEWCKRRTKTLQERLAAQGYAGILLTDKWNIIYFTGLFHTNTERMMHVFIPTPDGAPIWFFPALDRDLVRSWWYGEGDMYFDWLDVAGAAPQEGRVVKGPTLDLWRWALEGVKRRGFAKRKIAVDKELVPSAQNTVAQVLGAPMASAADDCLYLRERKTPEELALTRRAYSYFDRIHAYARDLLLTHGTDLTDYDLANAAQKYGAGLILADIRRDGGPHTAVGIEIGIECRVGRGTGYPHPNQFHYNKIERGKALQVAGVVTIGGCGGELYRPYMIAPRTEHMEKLWRATRDACLMQQDLSRKGTPCADVAFQIHDFQVKRGMQKYIYHRPAHGQGMEGHQPPYLSLGDHTVLDTGMCFSVEPGLFDPETGTGANFSDVFAVQASGPARQMSRLPWSEERAWINL